VYRAAAKNKVGVSLTASAGSIGERVMRLLADQAEALRKELPGATIEFTGDKSNIFQNYNVGNLDDPSIRADAAAWLQERTNAFGNALRPRVRSVLRELDVD